MPVSFKKYISVSLHILSSVYLPQNNETLIWTIWWQPQTRIHIFALNVTNKSPHTTVNSLICITHNFWKHTDKQQCLMKCFSLQNKKTKESFWVFQPYFGEDDEFGVSVVLFLPFFYPVVLYNCSVRREDCSLCKNADQKYNCVWCSTTKSCIYNRLCGEEQQQCPPPKITDVRTIFLAFLLPLECIQFIKFIVTL